MNTSNVKEIPDNRVVYMLTPQDVLEKINKTVIYVKHHYSAIEKLQKRIKSLFQETIQTTNKCYFLKDESYMSHAVLQVIKDMRSENIIVIQQLIELDVRVSRTVIGVGAISDPFQDQLEIVNLLERI